MAAKEKKDMTCLDFQQFIETCCPQACKPVDLFRVARHVANTPAGPWAPDRLKLVVDADSCLDRLYGGYYSDWVCGGQWNRVYNFLCLLINACHNGRIELVIFFNGALELQRLKQWQASQEQLKKNAGHIFRHVQKKGTPPPKVWWCAPACLKTALRLAFRQIGITIACSIEDHHQEVMSYCRENNFHGILADGSDYAIFDPSHYFSSQHLKLTYKGALETIEYVIDEVAKAIDLHPKRLCLLAAILGSHILPFEELKGVVSKLMTTATVNDVSKLAPQDIIHNVAAYIRNLESTDDVDAIARLLFQNTENSNEKIERFKESVQYFVNGTQDGFLKLRFSRSGKKSPGSYPGPAKDDIKASAPTISTRPKEEVLKEESARHNHPYSTSGYANVQSSSQQPPEIVVDPPSAMVQDDVDDNGAADITADATGKLKQTHLEDARNSINGKGDDNSKKSNGAQLNTSSKQQTGRKNKISSEVMKIAMERHQKGLMSPLILQLLTQSEIKIDSCVEEEGSTDLPYSVYVYRPIRQHIYALLFDLNKQRASWKTSLKETKDKNASQQERPEVYVKEWFLVPMKESKEPVAEVIAAEPISWLAPGLHRMWLGQSNEDKDKRINAFLACMRCYDTPLMLNTSHVPPHLLIMCCVLRYLLIHGPPRIIRRQELDAFLAVAVSPMLQDVDFIQEMKLPMITTRGVQLAALFMRGVDHAILVNDVCGQPVPWKAVCPWMFFDGKLFHYKLLKANNNANLLDLCDGQMDQVVKVEHLRAAILQKLIPEDVFARPALPVIPAAWGPPMHDVSFRPAGAPPPMYGPGPMGEHGAIRGGMRHPRGAFAGHGPIDSRGGQLQIAGVVVGSWGPNTHAQQTGRGRGTHVAPPPQVLSVGVPRRGGIRGRGVISTRAHGGRARGIRPDYSSRARGDHVPMPIGVAANIGRGCTIATSNDGAAGLSMSELFQPSRLKPAEPKRSMGSPVSVSILDARYEDSVPDHHFSLPYGMGDLGARPNGFGHLQ